MVRHRVRDLGALDFSLIIQTVLLDVSHLTRSPGEINKNMTASFSTGPEHGPAIAPDTERFSLKQGTNGAPGLVTMDVSGRIPLCSFVYSEEVVMWASLNQCDSRICICVAWILTSREASLFITCTSPGTRTRSPSSTTPQPHSAYRPPRLPRATSPSHPPVQRRLAHRGDTACEEMGGLTASR